MTTYQDILQTERKEWYEHDEKIKEKYTLEVLKQIAEVMDGDETMHKIQESLPANQAIFTICKLISRKMNESWWLSSHPVEFYFEDLEFVITKVYDHETMGYLLKNYPNSNTDRISKRIKTEKIQMVWRSIVNHDIVYNNHGLDQRRVPDNVNFNVSEPYILLGEIVNWNEYEDTREAYEVKNSSLVKGYHYEKHKTMKNTSGFMILLYYPEEGREPTTNSISSVYEKIKEKKALEKIEKEKNESKVVQKGFWKRLLNK